MKRPWQVWTLYGLCLALVLIAMSWLTLKALELDRAGARFRQAAHEARGQAERQELLSTALWRLDWMLTPLVAQEAARPYFVYQPFYEVVVGEGKGQSVQRLPSPLLIQPSEYVLLHFELRPNDDWSSPQRPVAALRDTALANGTTQSNIRKSNELLGQLQVCVDHSQLLTMLPERLLPPIEPASDVASRQVGLNTLAVSEEQVVNDLGLSQIPAQIENLQDFDQQAANAAAQQAAPRAAGQMARQQARLPAAPLPNRLLRGGQEWQKRNSAYQNFASNLVRQQRALTESNLPVSLVREGISRPLWLDDKLLLARRVVQDDEVVIQGCWLNWERLKAVLRSEISDLLPDAELVPATPTGEVVASRTLATLPAQLVAAPTIEPLPPLPSLSPICASLIIAWISLLTVAIAVAVLLQGAVNLSERRGAFVSAVTHELRTPLTTFRMYAEMLSEGMVPDAEQRRRYLDTLRVEADRLAHLVENVLQYARLERGRGGRQRETLSVEQLLDRLRQRLGDRAAEAEKRFAVAVPEQVAGQALTTDPVACEQILFNLVDNACKYAAPAEDDRIELQLQRQGRQLWFRVRDHGPGLSQQAARRLFRPFAKSDRDAAHSAPGVGLGLALCRRLARQLGGDLRLESSDAGGTAFVLQLPL